ncbi:uncharacterized protein LOC123693117 [Colias croceus]|uniref:uncharacterized protein LOC123693117 n=1 Tax=Colias crocea TaxID=72248 RepID=UPI001E27B9E3|nr:uncharacterized protein LOC123693117 [Colias croceus]
MIPLGRKQAQVLASFVPSMVAFGGAAFTGMLYATDWKVFTAYIPFYSGKYEGQKTEE